MKKRDDKKNQDKTAGKKVGSEKQSLQREIDSLQSQLRCALADYRNIEARIEKEVSLFKKDTVRSLIDKLLAVLDNLERAESHIDNKGLKMAVGQFKDVLASEGIMPIKSDGEVFDPIKMDCMQITQGPKDIVVETVTKGYEYCGEVIRPAKVRVGQGNE